MKLTKIWLCQNRSTKPNPNTPAQPVMARIHSIKNCVETLLSNIIPRKHLDSFTIPPNLEIFNQAFTAQSWDPAKNYEYLEQLGDVTANKALVWYFYRRFPPLACSSGVKVVARLKINYSSKKCFSKIANDLGFWKLILASDDDKFHQRDDLLEDSFEAFVGAIEMIADREFGMGTGSAVAYNFVKNIFDKMDISLHYEDLFDSKTRLKEIVDKHGQSLGRIQYKETRQGMGKDLVTTSIVTLFQGHGKRSQVLGIGRRRLKSDAQREASTIAIAELKRRGFSKEPAPEYSKFAALPGQNRLCTLG